MDRVYKYIVENTSAGKIDKQVAIQLLTDLKEQMQKTEDDIAIIGMSVNMPFASDIREFWENLKNGRDCIVEFPDSRRKDIDNYLNYTGVQPQDKMYMKGAYLEDIASFDYQFFHFTPKEASLMDPCQRLFLQTAWQAIEDAGYSGDKLTGTRTGIYIGFATTLKDSYQKLIYDMDPSSIPVSIIATLPAMIPTRLSYMLDLKGPTISVDTACSSSLVAVHLACMGIRNGECDMAIAGGVKLHTVPIDNENVKLGIEASDGRTKAFDDSSDGAGTGEGIGAVLLKPYKKAIEDKDNVYAVIKGSAINQDGRSIGITAPNQIAQAEVIMHAWKNAGISPETISYIQTHGTGTELGDPIEIDGMKKAFEKYTSKKQFCAIGSVKTNVGHLYEASGIINLITAALAVKNGRIPPSLHIKYPNRKIRFEDTPVYVNDKLTEWLADGKPRRCGVSSFGFSGTNCHIVLEEHPGIAPDQNVSNITPNIFVLSAQSEEVLKEILRKYRQWLLCENNYSLEDICFTANTGRNHHNCRIAFVAYNRYGFQEKIEKLCKYEMDDTSSHGCYWGVVRTDQKSRGKEKSKEASLMNNLAKRNLEEFLDLGSRDVKKLEELCLLYTRGAAIHWDMLYKNKNVKRISMPAYTFEKNRCWLEADKQIGTRHYQLEWEQEEMQTNRLIPPKGTYLIFKDEFGHDTEIADVLKENGSTVVEVTIGREYAAAGDNSFTVGNCLEDYMKLIKSVMNLELTGIIHLASIRKDQRADSLESLEKSQQMGVFSLFYLSKAVAAVIPEKPVSITIISRNINKVNNKEEFILPENASLSGLGRVIGKEILNIRCKCIDLDMETSIVPIITELANDTDVYQVAYRSGKRYVEVFKESILAGAESTQVTLREKGVYVITGGLGGIGLEMAKYLAKAGRVNIALINRTELPERNLWDEILLKDTNGRLSKKIGKIMEIESYGARIIPYAASISDYTRVKQIFDELGENFGSVNGIIHCAGISENRLLIDKSDEEFRETILPKIHGTWILDELTNGYDLDFFVMASSVATVFSTQGQGDYTAANSYLDSFAWHRNLLGKRALSVDWVTWKEAGMAVEQGFKYDTIFKTISTEHAMEAFDRALKNGMTRVLIGEINYENGISQLIKNSPFKISDDILNKLDSSIRNFDFKRQDKVRAYANVKLEGRKNGEKYSDIEKTIAHICREEMGYSEIDVKKNFFELGGDSITMTRVRQRLNEKYHRKVSITDIFEYSTIEKLASFIEEQDKAECDSADLSGNETGKDTEAQIACMVEELEKGNVDLETVLKDLEKI